MSAHRYSLQKYTGMSSKHKCPRCGRRSFTYYIDTETGKPIAEHVGRCDHESSCGYHYKPREYLADNPLAREQPQRAWQPHGKPQQVRKTLCVLPREYIAKCLCAENNLFYYLRTLYDDTTLIDVARTYYIGSTKQQEAIFWQIDAKCRLRTGKIMAYNVKDGHRIKGAVDGVDWVHARLKRANILPKDWELTQCLFGEHLLQQEGNARKVVGLVESEKTAIVCAIVFPEYLWLATGGKHGLSADRLRVLEGRTLMMFPDIDAFDEWQQRAKELTFCKAHVSDVLQRLATDEDKAKKIDIADVILREARNGHAPVEASTKKHVPQKETMSEAEQYVQHLMRYRLFRKLSQRLDLVLVQ